MSDFTSLSEVERIAALEDAVSRNLQITQSYHELSLAMTKRTGLCANWCTFATWASKQAGQTIRREDFSQALENALKATPEIGHAISAIVEAALLKGSRLSEQGILKLIWETIDLKAASERASAAVAVGNRKVFAEIAREFARFIDACLADEISNEEKILGFCATLKPGNPPDGQRYLLQAFSRYYQAFFETDGKSKAELTFLANLEIGFHEQTRLQPEIAAAMEAAVEDPQVLKRRLLDALFPNSGWIRFVGALYKIFTGRPTPLDDAITGFSKVTRHRIRLFLTKHFMELAFPQALRLRLGRDLNAGFPASLEKLTNTDLVNLLKQVDPTQDSLRETGAIDWADLPDRLHFIADLFRCYHETSGLLEPPFAPEQVAAIKAGLIPAGEL